MTTTLDHIAAKAKTLAETRTRMAVLVTALNDALRVVMEAHMPSVRVSIDAAAVAWTELEAAVQANPLLFIKPKKVALHGIVCGFEKGKGGLEIPNPAKTVALIKKHFADQADVLIDTKEKPAKGALNQLQVADLKRLAVNVKAAGDQVVIRPEDGAVDKLVKALIKSVIDQSADADADVDAEDLAEA